ncbi:MAG: hypothetical protein KF696_10925 [Planctomycetes bacterium]|nr:hypothetical protein [Planctomycetota bacterium]MCW8135836.1 hypothetical protein [Planctomycetota bacterium]
MSIETEPAYVFPDASSVWFRARTWIASLVIVPVVVGYLVVFAHAWFPAYLGESSRDNELASVLVFAYFLGSGTFLGVAPMWLVFQHLPTTWRRACRARGLTGRAGLFLLPRLSGQFNGYTFQLSMKRLRPSEPAPGATTQAIGHHGSLHNLLFQTALTATFNQPLPDWLQVRSRSPAMLETLSIATTGNSQVDEALVISSDSGHAAQRLAQNKAFVAALRSRPQFIEFVHVQDSKLTVLTVGYTAKADQLDALLDYVIWMSDALVAAFAGDGSHAQNRPA